MLFFFFGTEDLTTQKNRLASLLKTQENHRMELACKYESLDKSFEDQSKKLRAATGQVRLLTDRFQLLEKRQCELNMEVIVEQRIYMD